MNMQELTTLLGWSTVINASVLIISTLILLSARRFVSSIHSRMFNVDKQDMGRLYMEYLGQFKIVTIVFNLAPYIALRIMAG